MKTDFPLSSSEALTSEPINAESSTLDETIWSRLRAEAAQERMSEASLISLYRHILNSRSFEDALARSLVRRLGHPSFPAENLRSMLLEPLLIDNSIGEAARADLSAVVERDPASGRLMEPFLFFKGYAAIQTHRLTHWLWSAGKRDMALYLQSRSSEIFQTDIHPGAQIGKGVFLDHATGFVAGETVVIEDNVSILHGVTLGGTGTENSRSPPQDQNRRLDRGWRARDRQYRNRSLFQDRSRIVCHATGSAPVYGGRCSSPHSQGSGDGQPGRDHG